MPEPLTARNARLIGLIARDEVTLSPLPLMHTTDAYRFADMIASGKIEPKHCPVFEVPLVYMFYGRPSYRTRRQSNSQLTFDLPVVLVMRRDADLPDPRRIYPFDTGAFAANMYKPYFHNDAVVDDFYIGSEVDDAIRFLEYFYTSNAEYFNGMTRRNVHVPFGNFEAEGLLELARAPADGSMAGASPDDRASAVEFQFSEEIDLHGSAYAMIVPMPYMDSSQLQTSMEALSPGRIVTYDVMSKMGRGEVAGIIYERVRQVIEDMEHGR